MLNFPKVEFTPHPAGQHQGDIFEVEVRLQEETPWGLKDKIILKIQSETPMLDEDGNQRTDQSGEPMFFNIWEFLTLTRTGKLGDRRAAIRKVGYVIKHKPGKEQGTISASIETMWPIGKIPTTKEAPPAVAKDDDLPF